MEEIAIRTPEEIGYMREAGRILVGLPSCVGESYPSGNDHAGN